MNRGGLTDRVNRMWIQDSPLQFLSELYIDSSYMFLLFLERPSYPFLASQHPHSLQYGTGHVP